MKHFRTSDSRRASRLHLPLAGTIAAASILLFGLSTLPSASANVASVHSASTSTKPDFSYFNGKTVTWIVGGAVGGQGWEWATAFASELQNYLHCTINVEDQPLGNTIPAQDDTDAAPANGLTWGVLGPVTDLEDDVKGVANISFSLKKVVIMGAVEPASGSGFVAEPSSGITSFRAMEKAGTFNWLDQTSGVTDLETRVLVGAYHLKANIVTGFANIAAEDAGLLAGDGAVALGSTSYLLTQINNGSLKPIVLASPPARYDPDYAALVKSKAPTYAQLLATNPPKGKAAKTAMQVMMTMALTSNDMLFAPQGTPASIALAVTDAYRSVAAQKNVQQALEAQSLSPTYISPAQAQKDIAVEVKDEAALAPFLNG